MTDTSGPPDAAAETDAGEPQPVASYPPYPPYAVEPVPPSVADAIHQGRHIRREHKSVLRKPVRSPPKPARPRGPKATDVKMSKRAARAHARCLRRHNAVLTDRLEYMSKPRRRNIIYMWREHADILSADTIARLRSMLDADEPFKPDQAYEYFINLRKAKKRNAALRVKEVKKDILAICANKRFTWARNATVQFARGIQQRLAKPGRYSLADGMLRLSNIIMHDICSHMHIKTPSRSSRHPKAKFMMEMSDKVAIWIDEILAESDDRMLMMDFDEDEEVEKSYEDDRPKPPPPQPEPELEGEASFSPEVPASPPPTIASPTNTSPPSTVPSTAPSAAATDVNAAVTAAAAAKPSGPEAQVLPSTEVPKPPEPVTPKPSSPEAPKMPSTEAKPPSAVVPQPSSPEAPKPPSPEAPKS